MRNLISAVQHRDGSAMARIAGDVPLPERRGVNEGVERLVDMLFANLKQLFPASVSTALKDPRDEAAAKRQWIAAFAENGITNREQLAAGMKHARASLSPFWPSPGQFIDWCKEGELKLAGLPDADELVAMVHAYCARRGFYDAPEAYPWEKPAHYWLVTALYSGMRANTWTEAELLKRAASELAAMAARISRGEEIPEPRVMLPKLGNKPLSQKEGLAKIAEIRKKFGIRGGRA
ncbi:Phage DNA replication protein P [Cronobacter dublinensis 1210]|uniref:Phage DNA replication protein P n=1 Tax=Cronobacter dublinensis 1210 TaxID=1208656 RepID=A0ABM9QD42_9ENTR|nr:replication protein P [Cronobacter dublinensis]ALB67178.1 DNA replication protein [Cronobacter dublinensis subsp. dublinensis LMG 23823]MDI7270775.1 replication protein P [Cronobacter dublinensis]CCJ83502.1 Phage DNA replication protein P [Cronobacter dublinensis 1210]